MKKLKGKQLVYTLCFFGIVMIEFFVKNPIEHGNLFGYFFERMNNFEHLTINSGFQQLARESIGVIMAVLVLSHYSLDDFKSNFKFYAWWPLVWTAGFGIICFFGSIYFNWYPDDIWSGGYLYSDALKKVILVSDFIYVSFLVFLWGIVLITVFADILKKKQLPKFNRKLFFAWIGLMLLMLFSGSNYIWPFSYLVMFGCFYLTEYTSDEKDQIFHGALNGLLAGFFVLQLYSLLVFPYTKTNVRYLGFNANPNWSSLFYAIILAAVYIKIIYHFQKGSSFVRQLPYWILVGIILSLEFFTIGKIGYITVVVESIVLICCLSQKQIKRYFTNAFIVIVCFLIMFPITFAAVRYIPAYSPLPSGLKEYIDVDFPESADSEEYMSMEYLLETSIGRIATFIIDTFTVVEEDSHIDKYSKVMSLEDQYGIRLSDINVEEGVLNMACNMPMTTSVKQLEELPPNKIPVLTEEEERNSFLTRTTIYKYYLSHLKLFGQPYEEQGFQITVSFWIGHAHNIFLQFGTDFGIIALIYWMIILVISFVNCIKEYMHSKSIMSVSSLYFLLVPLVFGIFEYSWGDGALSIAMMFISGWFVLRSDLRNK